MRNSLVVVWIYIYIIIYIYNWASAAKPHMDDTSGIFHICIIYYRRTSDRSNFVWWCTARRPTAHAPRCVKLKQGQPQSEERHAAKSKR